MTAMPDHDAFRITVRDENLHRNDVTEMLLEMTRAKLTARDLIAERVRAECDKRLTDRMGNLAARLVGRDPKERALNKTPAYAVEDTDRRVSAALDAFKANGFVLLLDDRQIETLDEEVVIGPESVVTFLRLTPLVGG